jgi:hypothetical protein
MMKTKILPMIMCLCGFSLISGCATHLMLSDKTYPPKAADAPIEIVELSQESRKYEVIGIVSVAVDLVGAKSGMTKLKAEARKIGADAIATPDTKYKGNVTVLEAKAIHYKD